MMGWGNGELASCRAGEQPFVHALLAMAGPRQYLFYKEEIEKEGLIVEESKAISWMLGQESSGMFRISLI